MLRVFANNHYFTFALNDFTFFANLFYGWFYFHRIMPTFLGTFVLHPATTAGLQHPFPDAGLFGTPGNTSLVKVVDRDLNGDFITRENSYKVHSEFSG